MGGEYSVIYGLASFGLGLCFSFRAGAGAFYREELRWVCEKRVAFQGVAQAGRQ